MLEDGFQQRQDSQRIVNDVLQDTETESAESVSQEEEMEH